MWVWGVGGVVGERDEGGGGGCRAQSGSEDGG